MAIHTDPVRSYRRRCRPRPGETAFQVVVEQTDLQIIARENLSREITDFVERIRAGLKNHILLTPGFRESLVPFPAPAEAPPLVRDMARAAALFGVGPMAAVAGAVAQAVVDRFAAISPDLIVENGGDVVMASTAERVVGLLAAPRSGARLGLRIPKASFPLSICASSATIGHSLSLGRADLVSAVARQGAVADAAATALANLVHGPDDLAPMLETARTFRKKGLLGVFAQAGDKVAAWGEIELTPLDTD